MFVFRSPIAVMCENQALMPFGSRLQKALNPIELWVEGQNAPLVFAEYVNGLTDL